MFSLLFHNVYNSLLQVAAGYTQESSSNHINIQKKRQMFVKACVKMTLQWAHRYKNILSRHHSQIELALTKMLDRMEQVITSSMYLFIASYIRSGLI